jgi:hypothetical protein
VKIGSKRVKVKTEEFEEPKEGTFRIVRVVMGDGKIFFHNEEFFKSRHKYICRVQSLQSKKTPKGLVFNIPSSTKINGEYSDRIFSWLRYPVAHSSMEEAMEEQIDFTKNTVKEETYIYVN